MNNKTKQILKNLRYAVSANLFVMIISIITNLVLPIFLSVENYGYWQLYLFYYGYVGFFHFGWLDGIYLAEGGNEYQDIDHRKIGSEFWYHLVYEIFIASIIVAISLIWIEEQNKLNVILFTSLAMVVTNCRTFLLLLFQATNRIKEYASLARNDRYIFLLIALPYIFLGGKNYLILVFIDIFSKIVMLVYGCYIAKDLIFIKILALREVIVDIKNNIISGSSLMLSTIASGLITGSSRLFVENHWNISTFAKLSFTLSVSNMIMTFINAVSVVIFPLLRKTDWAILKELYLHIRGIFVAFSFAILLMFFPLVEIISSVLPEYKESIKFMGILFPMVIFEGRMSLLVSTFLKTIRKEKHILVSNLITLIISVLLAYFSVFILENLILVVVSILLSITLRCLVAEKLLSKELEIDVSRQVIAEILITVAFVICNRVFMSIIGFFVYLTIYVCYIFYNKVNLVKDFRYIKNLTKN